MAFGYRHTEEEKARRAATRAGFHRPTRDWTEIQRAGGKASAESPIHHSKVGRRDAKGRYVPAQQEAVA